jgi:simple sugar transport system ATP-binding protein
LRARGIDKSFGAVRVLESVDFEVGPGEVVALIGDNGAGKSTLINILTGVLRPDSGEIFFEDKRAQFATPHEARERGIETVYQDLAVAPQLDAVSNIFLGREHRRTGILGRLGFLDGSRMRRETEDQLTAALGVAQVEMILDLIRRVHDTGIPVVFISHNMPHVFEVADRISVLRLGEMVAELDPATATTDDAVAAMTGSARGNGEAA